MALRSIHPVLEGWFANEYDFAYAHLIKFEKPIKTEAGKSARKATDYVYLTDASRDIIFNDGSIDSDGNANGNQVYVAGKALNIGSVSETIEARATSMSIQVSAAALSTTVIDSYTVGASSLEGTKDLVAEGFREGDTLTLTSLGSNNSKTVRIEQFENDNKKIVVTPLETTLTATAANTTETITLTFKNPEVEGLLLDRGQSSYARYINREVFVYKTFINPDNGSAIDTVLIFKGIIAGGKITEDPNKSSIVSWSVTSHWGDFSRVQGRLTSDPYHRALDGNNIPDPQATIRPEYAGDLGFLHSEQAINLVAIYQVMETRYKLKKKSSFFGLKKSYSMEEYQVQVDREADLRFNLEARYLPVVYGVNKIDSIPVFVDTLNTDSKKVFVAYALCEGQIGGLYDIYFDDTSSICIDQNDSDTRSSQTAENTIDVLCQGRADRGDTLTSQNINSSTSETFPGSFFAFGNNDWTRRGERESFYVPGIGYIPILFNQTPGGASISGAGITHEKGTRFESPIDTRLQFHAGNPNQPANNLLLSNSDNFKVATDYYTGDDPYWGANHRLLDTAYVVAEYQIGEGETTIPSLEFVVRGKGIECFNYDYSYVQDPVFVGSDAAASVFDFGDTLTLKKVSDDSTIGTAVLADIYNITNINGQTETRIRFLEDPELGSTTNFYVQDGSNNRFTLVTYDHIAVSGTVPSELKHQVSSVSSNVTEGIDINLSNLSSAMQAALNNGSIFSIFKDNFDGEFSADILNNFLANLNGSTLEQVGTTDTNSTEIVNEYVVSADGITLASTSSNTDDAYNGYEIELTHKHDDGTRTIQKRIITDYDQSTKVATVDAPWEIPPHQNDTYKIFSVTNDIRVSTNPAMQLLDYLRSKRYGRDLDLEDDLDKESFFEAARACDTRSDVTMVLEDTPNGPPTVGDIYELQPSNRQIFQGTVKSVETVTIGGNTRYNVVFTDVLGKLGIRWAEWKYLYTDEYFYSNGQVRKATADGVLSTFTGGGSTITGISLGKKSGNASSPATIPIDFTGATFDGNPLIKSYNSTTDSYTSGYSLYDCDDVKYWRYLGWEAQNQRHVTRHQANSVIDTSKSIFENINSLLGHFNGMLRYSQGKYSLEVKTAAGSLTQYSGTNLDGEVHYKDKITEKDIIGSINVEDAGQKGTYNQVDVTINDPQNRFEGRSVMMFDSTYLKEDRMVPKKGSVRTPYVTNYYNARINAKQYLEESRAGLKINFTMVSRGIQLQAGHIIQIDYPRFGWTNKPYRITNLTLAANCLVQITAEEHSDSAFIVAAQERGSINPVDVVPGAPAAPLPPTNLSASTSAAGGLKTGGIELTWTNSTNFNGATYATEVWGGTSNNRNLASLLGITKSQRFVDNIVEEGFLSKFYWVRHVVLVPPQTGSQVGMKEIFSAYEPSGQFTGAQGGVSDGRNITLDLDNDAITVGGTEGENVTGFSESVTATVYSGSEDDTSNWSLSWNVEVGTANTSVTGSVSGANNQIYTLTQLNNGSGGEEFTYADIVVTATRSGYTTRQKVFTVTKILNGENGAVYKIQPTVNTIKYDPNSGEYEGGSGTNNNEVTFNFKKIQDGVTTSFAGKYSLDGGSTLLPSSGTATSAGPFTLVANSTERVDINLYNSDGTQFFDFADCVLVKEGLSARQVVISTDAQNFIKAKLQEDTYSPSYIALTAKKLGGVTGTANWSGTTFYSDTALTTSTTTGDTVYIGPSSVSSGSVVVSVSVADTSVTNGTTFTDSEEIGLLLQGADSITVSLSNDSVEIPSDSSGASPDFGNTSTNIQVFEGSTALTFDDDNTQATSALASGTFVLSRTVSNVTTPPVSGYGGDGTTAASSGTITAISADQGSITFSARGKRANGSEFTGIEKTQTFSKIRDGSDASLITVTADHQVFVQQQDGTISPSSITFTANRRNVGTGAITFTAVDENSNTVTLTGTGDTRTLTSTNFDANSSTSVTVTVSIMYDSVTYTDSESIERVLDGTNALVASLSNDNFTATSDADGSNPILTNSGTTIQVYEGSTALTFKDTNTSLTAGSFKVTRALSSGNISAPAASTYTGNNSTTAIVGSITALGSDSESITFTISGQMANSDSFSITKTQTFSKARKGDVGIDARTIVLTPSKHVVNYSIAGSESDSISFTTATSGVSATAYYKWYIDGTLYRDGTGQASPSGGTSNSGTLSGTDFENYEPAIGDSVKVTVELFEGSTAALATEKAQDSVTIYAVQDGSDAFVGFLTNASHSVAAENNGTSYSLTGAGGTFKFYKGGTATTAGVTFAPSSTTKNGLTLTINNSGVYTLSGNSWTSDLETFDLTATQNTLNSGTANPVVINQTYSISKSKKGAQGDPAEGLVLSADHEIFVKNSSGNIASPSSIVFTASRQNITGAVSFSTSPTVTLTGTGDSRTLTAANMGSNSSVTVTATVGSFSDSESVEVVQDGATGADAIVVSLSNDNHTYPADNSGNITTIANDGTDIAVYEGASKLSYNGSGTSNGTWTVTRTDSSSVSSPSTFTDLGTDARHAGISSTSSLTSDSGTITFNISGKTSDGTSFTASKVQTLSKVRKGDTGTSTTGSDGRQRYSFTLYYTAEVLSSANAPTPPTITNYTFSSGVIAGTNLTNWSTSAPTFKAYNTSNQALTWYYVSVTVVESLNSGSGTGDCDNSPGTGGSISVGSSTAVQSFNGLVAFTDLNNRLGSTTTINGDNITTGLISSASGVYGTNANGNFATSGTHLDLTNGRIRSTEFYVDGSGAKFKGTLSAANITGNNTIGTSSGDKITVTDGTTGSIVIDGNTNTIKIIDGVSSPVTRVILGKL